MKLFNALWTPHDCKQNPVKSIIIICNLTFTEHRKHVEPCQLADLNELFA